MKDARLVARGFSQQYGNEEIFIPVAKMTTVRVLISLAARFYVISPWSLDTQAEHA